jgi:hypothetical protein
MGGGEVGYICYDAVYLWTGGAGAVRPRVDDAVEVLDSVSEDVEEVCGLR